MPAKEALGAVSQIIEAYFAGRKVKQESEELAARTKEAEAKRKQEDVQFKAEQDLREKRFNLEQAQAEVTRQLQSKALSDEAEKTGNVPPGYTIGPGGESIQIAPGQAGTRLNYEPTGFPEEIRKYLPSFQARDPRTAAVQEAERVRQIGQPAQDFKIELENEKQKGKLAVEAAENQSKMQYLNANNLAKYNQAVEVQKMKNQGAYDVAALKQKQKDIESGKVKLSASQQDKRNSILEMQKLLGETKQLLDADKYSFYQGPFAGIDDQVKSFKGEDNPLWAEISSKLSLMRQIFSNASQGKSFTKTEEELVKGHIPSPDHMLKPTQVQAMINTLDELFPSMLKDIYAGNGAGIEFSSSSEKEAPTNPANRSDITSPPKNNGVGKRSLGEIFGKK